MIYNLYINQGRAGASAFALGGSELNVRDDELMSSEVAGVAWGAGIFGEVTRHILGKGT
jgi:hypothetical protein